jgi:hypothetical protein
MPVVVDECFKSRQQTGVDAQRTFYIKGTSDQDAARNAMLAHVDCPASLTVTSVSGPVTFGINYNECGVEEIDNQRWLGTAKWASPASGGNQPIGFFQLSFDISGQNQRITCSRQTINKYKSPATGVVQRDFKGAINVSQDGTIDGTEILIPAVSYTAKQIYGPGQITRAFVRNLASIVGSVNDGIYQGYQPGELLLTSVTGVPRSDLAYDLTFKFGVSLNEDSLTVGDITGIQKDGWDYLWVYYESKSYGADGVTVFNKVPINAFVERVYRRNNYSTLGLSQLLNS